MISKNTKITVYITSHNYGKYLQDAVESILRQSAEGWELILINDGSSDNTSDIMSLYKNDPRVRFFSTKGIGLPAVANFVLKKSRGKYIMRLDADDVADENIVLVLGTYLDKHPDIALVFPDYYLTDELGGITAQERRQPIHYSNHLLDMPANGACTMIRKEALLALGGYREDLGAQDGFDIWTKIKRAYKCANINLPLFYYRRHGKNLTENHIRIINARREIKKDACAVNLKKFRPITAVIPCRTNYDIYPNLWSMKINGETLLDRAIKTSMASSILDRIVVTCDNPAVKKVIANHKDKRLEFVERSTDSTLNSRPISHTLEHIIRNHGNGWKGITALLYIQAPLTTTSIMEESIYTLVMNDSDSAFAVQEIATPLYKRTPHGLMPISQSGNIKSDFDSIYGETMTSVATRNINLKTGSLAGAKISYFVVPKEESFFINSKMDFEIARSLMKDSRR